MVELYLIDSNVLMEAANSYYKFGQAESFWQWMTGAVAQGSIKSVSLVADEVEYPAELVDWVVD